MVKFLGNLFTFKAEKKFNRMNIQYILMIKNFPKTSVGQINKNLIIE
jgi:hypothetical protein